jgi:hypothetical protein
MLGLLLVIIAIVLAIVSAFVPTRSHTLLASAVVVGFIGVLVGVDAALS